MNFHEFHHGDHLRDTAHLPLIEEGALRRLIDLYYMKEAPLPASVADACRLVRAYTRSEREAVASVLREFFELRDDGWHKQRCDRELARFHDKQRKAKASADARWSAQRSQSDGNANASSKEMRTHCDGNALQSPVPSPQSPVRKTGAKAPLSATRLPPCPQLELLELFTSKVPDLSKPRAELWETSTGAEAMRQRWKWFLTATREGGNRYATNAEEAVACFERFFTKVSESDFLTGRNSAWRGCTLAWLMKRENFAKVIEGAYDNDRRRRA